MPKLRIACELRIANLCIAAFFMNSPTSLVVSKLFYPETEESQTAGENKIHIKSSFVNGIDAVTTGAIEGVKLAVNVGVVILAFLALLAAGNAFLGWVGTHIGLPKLSFEWILSFIMAPIAWLIGVPWVDCSYVGALLGKKTILNEFIAYVDLSSLIKEHKISQRAIILATYALCNFANIGTIGVMIGGIPGLVLSRQHDLARLSVRTMLAGLLASFITASIAGVLI